MPILAHLVAGVAAFAFLSTMGYGFAQRLAFRDGQLRLIGTIKLVGLLMVLPFAVALFANAALGIDGAHPLEWLPYVVSVLAFLGLLRSRGIDTKRWFGFDGNLG
ncbi:MAG: hypothetical protein ACE10K_04450 [Rhodothermales bacterium]